MDKALSGRTLALICNLKAEFSGGGFTSCSCELPKNPRLRLHPEDGQYHLDLRGRQLE